MRWSNLFVLGAALSLMSGPALVAQADRLPIGVPPGAPAPGAPTNIEIHVQEPDVDTWVTVVMPNPVYVGYVVIMETTLADSLNEAKWSDVVAFGDPSAANDT